MDAWGLANAIKDAGRRGQAHTRAWCLRWATDGSETAAALAGVVGVGSPLCVAHGRRRRRRLGWDWQPSRRQRRWGREREPGARPWRIDTAGRARGCSRGRWGGPEAARIPRQLARQVTPIGGKARLTGRRGAELRHVGVHRLPQGRLGGARSCGLSGLGLASGLLILLAVLVLLLLRTLLLFLSLPLLVLIMAELAVVCVEATPLGEEATPLAEPLRVLRRADGGKFSQRHSRSHPLIAALFVVLPILIVILSLATLSGSGWAACGVHASYLCNEVSWPTTAVGVVAGDDRAGAREASRTCRGRRERVAHHRHLLGRTQLRRRGPLGVGSVRLPRWFFRLAHLRGDHALQRGADPSWSR
mmetsp:Transcript_137207/g.293128  ORF Transcript_137207/g.293128 Transcript_137207/m.293128 type:complete len:360 (+) Transcript_137207:307-1386(+)